MRYDEFRDQLQDALREAGLSFHTVGNPTETVDLADLSRSWRVYLSRPAPQSVEPFHVSAKIAFVWNPLHAARAQTCEEDLLTTLLGRKQESIKTERRWARIDLELRASLPYGSTTPMPDPQLFGSWSAAVGEKLDKLLTEFKERQGRVVTITGSRDEVAVEVQCKPGGVLSLKRVSVSGFRIVRVPRVWDNPDRQRAEKGIGEELARLARRFESALDEWTGKVAELARWIRYAPPPPDAKQVEPRFEDEQEDDDGPETIH